MKLRIIYSNQKDLFLIQSKHFLSEWETMKHYFLTDSRGNLNKLRGFPTYQQAEDWIYDRYPEPNLIGAETDIIFGHN